MKTPWNPSKKATARVLDPLPEPTICRLCGGPVEIRSHREVYGRNYSTWPWLFVCTLCAARVGMHPFTCIPLGTLADDTTRKARQQAKVFFESLWDAEKPQMSRTEAYAWLATKLGLTLAECHFGMFDVPMCDRAQAECEQYIAETTTNRKGP